METPRIFPTFPRPRNLEVWETGNADPRIRLALKSLQGLVNKEEPRLYEITAPCDEHWLDYYEKRFEVKHARIDDPNALFEKHSTHAKGLVIYDPAVPDTRNLAITIAGLDDLLPASPEFAEELANRGFPLKQDLRGRFKDRLTVYRWALENLQPRCNPNILGSLCVGNRGAWIQNRIGLVDYLVANKSFIFHLSAARRDREENRLFDEILDRVGSPGVVMGWHCARDQEKEYVSRAARKGFFVLCSASSPNLTVHGGIPRARERYEQRPPKALERIEQKVYVTIYLTDGDANWAMNNLQSDNWISKNRGKLPFNWGLLPLMYDMSPGMLEYYYETATDNDYFACPSSGAAYTYSFLHGDWYLKYSKHYMDLSGQRVVNMVNWDTNFWWREVEDSRAIYREKRILSPLGLVCGLGGSVFATSYPTGTPKIHAATILHVEDDDCAKKITEMAHRMKERPLFIFAFAQIAKGVYDHLVETLSSLPSDVELVNMDTFMMTLREATRQGIVREEIYPSKEKMAELTLAESGRQELAASRTLLAELDRVTNLAEPEMRRELNLANWHNLASRPPSRVLADPKGIRKANEGYLPYDTTNLADALGYTLFYMTWAYVRAKLNVIGRYANHMDRCLDDYLHLFPDPGNNVLEDIWEMWHRWYSDPPTLSAVKGLVAGACRLAERDE